jgi:hypothetical protein
MNLSKMNSRALIKGIEVVSPLIFYGIFPRFRILLLIFLMLHRQNIDSLTLPVQKVHTLSLGMKILTLVLLWHHSLRATGVWSRLLYTIIDSVIGAWIMSQRSLRSTLSILPFDRIAQTVLEKWVPTTTTTTDQPPTILDILTTHYYIITEYVTSIATYSVTKWLQRPQPFFTCLYWALCAWYIPGFLWTFFMLTLITVGVAYTTTFARRVLHDHNNNDNDENDISWVNYVYSSLMIVWQAGTLEKPDAVLSDRPPSPQQDPTIVGGFDENRLLRSLSELGQTSSTTFREKPTPAETMAMLDNILSSTLTDMFTKTKSA